MGLAVLAALCSRFDREAGCLIPIGGRCSSAPLANCRRCTARGCLRLLAR